MLAFITLLIGYFIDPSYSTFLWSLMIGMVLTSVFQGYFGQIIKDIAGVYILTPVIYSLVLPNGFFSFIGAGTVTIIAIFLVKLLIDFIFGIIVITFFNKR